MVEQPFELKYPGYTHRICLVNEPSPDRRYFTATQSFVFNLKFFELPLCNTAVPDQVTRLRGIPANLITIYVST